MSKLGGIKNIVLDFDGNPQEAITKVSKVATKAIGNLDASDQANPVFKKITNELQSLATSQTKDKIKENVNNIIEYSKEGLDLIANKEYKGSLGQFKSAGKEVLSCIGNVFTAIKEGLQNGFDSVKHGLGVAYKKLESLARGKEQQRE
jgi:hypothetical protein